jgi:hypothetical protein
MRVQADAVTQPSTSAATQRQPQWFVQMEQAMGAGGEGENNSSYEQALERYMRGEMTYEQFVQSTGEMFFHLFSTPKSIVI